MDPIAAIIAGLAATAVMTALIYLGPMMGMPRMDMVGMLGTMVSPDQRVAYPLGTVIHFVDGAIIALIYALLWSRGLGDPTWIWGLVFGAVHGVIAIAALPMMLRIHPRPPAISPSMTVIVGMMMGHLVYGLLVALVYPAVAGR